MTKESKKQANAYAAFLNKTDCFDKAAMLDALIIALNDADKKNAKPTA